MKFLIIGGTQFIGKRVVEKLLMLGNEVTIFSRGNIRPEFWKQIVFIQGDRHNYKEFLSKRKPFRQTDCSGR